MLFLSTFPTLAAIGGRRLLPLLLAAGLAGCGGPSASTEAPTVPAAATGPAADSARATLTTPAPDATGTRADTATQPTPPKPVPKPKAALRRPATQPAALVAAAAPAPEVAGVAPAAEPAAPAAPATRTQAGRVVDEAGHPLVGATILLKGSSKGTSTDANGNYTLEVPGGENTFLIGYGGYEDETATTRDGQPLNVTLLPTPGTSKKGRRGRK